MYFTFFVVRIRKIKYFDSAYFFGFAGRIDDALCKAYGTTFDENDTTSGSG